MSRHEHFWRETGVNVGSNFPGDFIVDAKLMEQLQAGYRELHGGAARILDETSEPLEPLFAVVTLRLKVWPNLGVLYQPA